MNGILPIDKPSDFTSFDVIAKLRGVTHTKKIGHSGTLDPMATGVLPLFFGKATKVCSILPDEDKCYIAGIKFGITTDTQDISGKIIEEKPSAVTKGQFDELVKKFIGKQKQTPPMYSAVKVGGVPLYDIARKGKEVERAQKDIEIYSISVLNFDEDAQTAEIEVSCGKGTYIRTLIADMGEKLGFGAAMTSLRRTGAAGFSIDDCYTIDEVSSFMKEGTLEEKLIPIDRLFENLPRLILSEFDEYLYKNGVPLELGKRKWNAIDGDIAVYGKSGELLGISYMDFEANELHLKKMLYIK